MVLALASFSASKCVFAADPVSKDTVFQAVVEDYLTLTLDDANMSVETTMTSTFGSGYVTASAATNNAYGYTLSMQDSDSRNGLEREGYATASEENKSKFNIPSVTADTAYADLAGDSWGYFLGSTAADQATYKQIPLETTEILSSNSNTSGLETARVNFGVKISEFRPSGLYEDEITFTLVANGPPPVSLEQAYGAAGKSKVTVSGNQYYVMQDMTPEICSNTTEIPSNLQVVDIRDNTIYLIGKLVDNRCWLLDNLALDLVAQDASTNITVSNTNADQASLTSLFYGNRPNGGQYATVGVSIMSNNEINNDNYYYSAPKTYNSYKNATRSSFSNPKDPLNEADEWKFGVYYNYCAASAGSFCFDTDVYPEDRPNTAIDVYDICPSGWRMPTGAEKTEGADSGYPDGGEYKDLYDLFSSNNGVESQNTSFRKVLRLPLPSTVQYGFYDIGQYGTYWSATMNGTEHAMTLYLYKSNIDPGHGNTRRNRLDSVRCIAKTGTEPAPSGN